MSDKNPYAPPAAPSREEQEEDDRELYGRGRVRGWLAFFCAVLMYISPAVFVLSTFLEYSQVEKHVATMPGLMTTLVLEALFGGAIVVFGVIAGRRLHQIRRDAVPFAKKFLLANVAFTTFGNFMPFVLMPTMTDEGRRAVTELATKTAGRGFVFFAIWFLYLTYSKQVRALFPR